MKKQTKEKKKLTPLQQRRRHMITRNLIQGVFFVFFPSLFVSAFNGIKYIFQQMGKSEALEMNSFLVTTIALCLFTVLFGRFFCGYACAFGTLNDAIRALYVAVCKKFKKKPITLSGKIGKTLSAGKYLVLAVILTLCVMKLDARLHGTSPWSVFSYLRAGKLQFVGYTIGIILLVLLLIGMVFCERFFCRFFCPMGAVFALLPTLQKTIITRKKETCAKGCAACTRICPADIDLPERDAYEVNGECFQCGKCVGVCPRQNAGISEHLKGTEIWFSVLRAILLLALSVLVTYGTAWFTAV